MRDRAARLELVTWILALLVGAWLRVPTETWLTHWDEGAYVAGPQHLGPFARDEPLAVYAPPLLPYTLEGARRVFGVDPGRAIAVVAAFGVAAIVAAGWLARSLRGRAAGMFAVWCMALSPLSIAYSRMALTDVPFTALVIFSSLFFVRGLRTGSLTSPVFMRINSGKNGAGIRSIPRQPKSPPSSASRPADTLPAALAKSPPLRICSVRLLARAAAFCT